MKRLGNPALLVACAALASCVSADASTLTGSKTDAVILNPLSSAPSCPAGLGCMYALSSDSQLYDVDAAGLVLKAHAAKAFRPSASCAGLSSPQNGDVCYDSSIPAFRYYSSGWTSGPVDDSLVVHKAGTETISGAKTFGAAVSVGGNKLVSVATPTASSDGANKGYVDAAAPELWFTRTCTVTSAAAGTPVTCLSDAAVGSKTAYLMGWRAKVNGATAWATTTTCSIKDSSGLAVPFVTMPVAALTGNAFVGDFTSGVSQASAYSLDQGSSAGRGLVLVCDTPGTGSDLVVTIFGSVK